MSRLIVNLWKLDKFSAYWNIFQMYCCGLLYFCMNPLNNAFSKKPKIVFPVCQIGKVFFSKFYSMSPSKVCYISRAGPRAGTMRLSLWHLCRVLSTFPQPPLAITTPQQPLPHNTCRSIVQTFPSDPVAYVQSSSIPGLHHYLLILSSETGIRCGRWWVWAIYR